MICDICGRTKWDGGHALNERECDHPNGEKCRLYSTVRRYANSFEALKKASDEYGEGKITNIELYHTVRDEVRKALDENSPQSVVKETEPAKIIIHLLKAGLPLCRFSTEVPKDWPTNNKWAASLAELKSLPPNQVPCGECVRTDQRSKQRPT